MSNWKAGDIAILIKAKRPHFVGLEVMILGAGVCEDGGPGWKIEIPGHHPSAYGLEGMYWACHGSSLRKRRPPQDNLFTEWFQSHIITDPICVPSLEETMKRTQANLQQFADLKPVEREESNGL